jgi:type IV secretion system protein TrbG
MKYKIISSTVCLIISQQSLANKSITLFIPPAVAQQIQQTNYAVPNLYTGRSIFINSANAASNTSTVNNLPINLNTAPSTNSRIISTANAASSIDSNNGSINTGLNTAMPTAAQRQAHDNARRARNVIKPRIKAKTLRQAYFTPQQEAALNITEQYTDGTAIPTKGEAGRTVFIYGQKQPTIICNPSTVCMLELEKTEQIQHIDYLQNNGWDITPPQNGSNLITIHPTAPNLQTNALISTNKRIYNIKLQSTASRYMSLVSFSYPANDKEKWDSYYMINNIKAKADEKKQQVAARNAQATNNNQANDYSYSFIGNASFKPTSIWNDGVKTYIQLPKSVLSGELPIFQNINKLGMTKLVNQRYDAVKNIIEIDFKVVKGQLKLGQGKDKQIIDISYYDKSSSISLFMPTITISNSASNQNTETER